VIAVLLAAVLFGTTGTSQALGPDSATPFAIGAVRLALGGTALAVVALFLAARHRRTTDAMGPRFGVRPALLMAAAGAAFTVYQPLFFLGAERNGVTVSTVIALGSSPVLAGLLEWAITRRRPHLIWIGATALATLGVVLLGFGGGGSGGTDPVGLLGSLGAGASFAVIANAQRRLLDAGWDPFTVVGSMGAISAVGGLVALPFVPLAWMGEPGGITMTLWLGLATVAVAYVLFTWGLNGLTAATAATLTLGEPLTASILGVTVLGEQLSALAVASLIVLAAGLVLLAWGSRSARDPGPFPIEA
jgi:DME family drug/metabolite transporter